MATEAALAAKNERSHNRQMAALKVLLEEGGAAGMELLERLKAAELPHRDMPWQASERNEIMAEVCEFLAYVLPDMRAVSVSAGEIPEGSEPKEDPALSPSLSYLLTEAGYGEDRLVRHATDEELLAVDGVGPETLEEIREVTGPYEPYITDITAMELPPEIVEMLTAAGFDTAESVAEAADKEILAIQGVGPAKLKEIREFFNPDRTRDTPDGPEAVG